LSVLIKNQVPVQFSKKKKRRKLKRLNKTRKVGERRRGAMTNESLGKK